MERWPTDKVGATTDWIEYIVPAEPDQVDEAGDKDNSPRLYRVNVSFMLSSWRCIFGQGCPGVLISGAMYDRGCCQIGVTIDLDEVDKLDDLVDQLTEEDLDADLLKDVKENGWRFAQYEDDQNINAPTRNGRRKIRKVLANHHTRVVDGACVLANRASGSLGAPGCALHRLAIRIGQHHSDTKPEICWAIPMSITEEYDEERGLFTVTVDGTGGHVWGNYDRSNPHSMGWWCVEAPEAYTHEGLVYRTNEVELRKLMGDAPYENMATILDGMKRRTGMPAEQSRKRIPLAVKHRVNRWREEGGFEAELARSKEVMKDLNIE